jgi:exosortase/archaeosortase family protein
MDRSITLHLALALACVLGLFMLMEHVLVLQQLLQPLSRVLAFSTEFVLRHMDVAVSRQGTVLTHPDGFSYIISHECSGIRPIGVIAATLLVVPASWRSRCLGLAMAVVAVEALNVLRLVHLYYTGIADADAFFVAHRVTWNIIAIVAVMAFLAVWLARSQRPARGIRTHASTRHAVQ